MMYWVIVMIQMYHMQHAFYELVQKYPTIIDQVSDIQLQQMMINIDIHEMMSSAVSFFQCNVVMEKNVLYIKHSVTDEVYTLQFMPYYVCVEQEDNPFFELVKRKYRELLIRYRE